MKLASSLDPQIIRATDAISISAVVAALAGWLPIVFAAVPAIYYAILIWESRTVRKWRRHRRHRAALRRRLKMAAERQRATAER